MVRFVLVSRASRALTLQPGEAVAIGGEMISGYSASHLSLLGPNDLDLEERGLSVTGDLVDVVTGRTLTLIQLRPHR